VKGTAPMLMIFIVTVCAISLCGCEDPYMAAIYQKRAETRRDLEQREAQDLAANRQKYANCIESQIPSDLMAAGRTSPLSVQEISVLADTAIQRCSRELYMLEHDASVLAYDRAVLSVPLGGHANYDLLAADASQIGQEEREDWIRWGKTFFMETCLNRINQIRQ